ncbi:MAG: homoserine kinase [Ignavibacteria bacterium]|nr:homoserine kinase [Ignavibacteria bacterium]
MKARSVKTFAPATISNIGPGFDVLGIAINRPGDSVLAGRRRESGVSLTVKTNYPNVPLDARRNVAGHVASLMVEEFKLPFGVDLVLYKRMPIGSGLGSSAASGVASALAVNALLPKPISKPDLLPFVLEGERLACGAPHADNAAPSLLGGACLIRSYNPLDVVSIPTVSSIIWVVVHPCLTVETRKARSVLPKTVPLRSAVHQWGNVGGLTVGLATGNARLVGKCIEDIIIEPRRARLIPGFRAVKDAALHAGALGCSISGSGPSVFSVASSPRAARAIATAMVNAFLRVASVRCDVYISRINQNGARISGIQHR